MRVRFPLAAKIALWFGLNLLLLAGGIFFFFRAQFGLGLETFLERTAGPRLQALADVVSADLRAAPRADWDKVLARFSEAYGVDLAFFDNDGPQLAGPALPLPAPVLEELTAGQRRPPPRDGRPPREGPPGRAGPGPGPRPQFFVRTANPTAYWVILRIPPVGPPRPTSLILRSPSLSAGGLLLDARPWAMVGGGALLLSVLLWLPLVLGLTRGLRRATAATARIAEGDFSVRVPDRRADELGTLATSVNQMAARLDSLVNGQKRFLADVAHELCSPIARMQAALGILENGTTDAKQKRYVHSVGGELQEMGALVNELLSFSKATLHREIALAPVPLAALAQRVIEREAMYVSATLDVPETLAAMGDPELLARALGNVVRNAVRYAGPFTISASARREGIVLSVADSGPGVAPEALARLFDAFYRPDAARTRESGGVGLGLAIVKSCVEACGGKVSAVNVATGGLQVDMLLQPAPAHSP